MNDDIFSSCSHCNDGRKLKLVCSECFESMCKATAAFQERSARIHPLLMENHDLGYEVNMLEEKITKLKARLDAYENGIAPEDAKPGKSYYIKYRGEWQSALTNENGVFTYDADERADVQVYPSRLYPLPKRKEEAND